MYVVDWYYQGKYNILVFTEFYLINNESKYAQYFAIVNFASEINL